MIDHYLLTLPILALLCLIFSKKSLLYPLMIVMVFVLNLPFLSEGLSLVDFLYSFVNRLSFFSLLLCFIVILQTFFSQKPLYLFLSMKAYAFIFITHLIFFILFLQLIPIDLYYQQPKIHLLVLFPMIIISYFFDKILAYLYLICFFAYIIKIFDRINIFDYYFDALGLVIAFVAFILTFRKRKFNNEKSSSL